MSFATLLYSKIRLRYHRMSSLLSFTHFIGYLFYTWTVLYTATVQQFIIYVFKSIHFNRIYLNVFRFKIPKFCGMTRTTCFYRAPSKSWNIIRSTSSSVIRTLWKWPLRACCMPKLKEHTQYLLCQVSNPTA